ncbi:MAG: hypothetical protein KDI03_19565, partial [Anaerolineae bacterium]|nr:hypothetical protein [Anaerolineae bacterium]
MRNNIAVRESVRKFKDNISQTSQPRRSVSSGYVSAVQEDAAGRVVTASVRTNGGGTVRAQVPFGQNVYTGMVVQIENYGSPSLASWAVSGSASLPPGTSGGIIYNQNGSNVLMFDNIWVTDDGYIRAGGTLDENDEPTGSRAQMDEFGFSAWDQYDRAMFRVFARDVEPYLTGDAYLGYLDGGRIEMSAQNLRFGIYNADEVVMQFDPLTGNRITQNLWVGDEAGPQVGIGKWTVDGEDVSIIVARNAGTGTVSDIGNEPVFMVTAAPSRTTLHLGDPDHSTNYVFYDSSANSGEGELTVDAILRAREIEIFGAGLIAEGGYIGAVAGGTSQAGIWLRPKYLEGIGNGGDRTFLLAAASVTLDKHPLLPALGALTWDGGEGYVGDVLHQHWRWDVRGPDGRAGMYYGDDPRVAFDPSGNVKM